MRKIIAVLVLLIVTAPVALGTALDDYVAAPDSNYSYRVVKTIEVPGCTGYVLEMTSQAWRSEKEVDRTVWKHWLTIIKPEKVASDIALLWITGGSNDRPAPERPEQMLVAIAQNSGSVVAEIRMAFELPRWRRASRRGWDHRLHIRQVHKDRRRDLAAFAADGQKCRPRDGRHPEPHRLRHRRQAQDK
jgi:hypothetical protein